MRYLRGACAALVAVGIAMVLLGGARPAAKATADAGDIVRLHVIADSDDAEAQRVKLLVRDALLDEYSDALGRLGSRDAVLEFLGGELANIEATAGRVLAGQGADYGARATLGECDFPDRQYGDTLVPAGRYMALRVELGRARGRNWWCVIYPALCALPPDVPDGAAPGDAPVLRSALWDWLCGVFGRGEDEGGAV